MPSQPLQGQFYGIETHPSRYIPPDTLQNDREGCPFAEAWNVFQTGQLNIELRL